MRCHDSPKVNVLQHQPPERTPQIMCSSARWRQLRLPFAIERTWIEPVLRRDPALADAYQRLFAPAPRPTQLPAPPTLPDQATALAIQPLTEREQEALITGGDSAPLIPGSGAGFERTSSGF